jgi:peptidoglycan/xylan/chitin deacetylase (PgdA/CDA1 family)
MFSTTHVSATTPGTRASTTESTTSTTAPATTSTTAVPRPRARAVYRVTTNDPVVFVTIDDGFTRDPKVIDFVRTQHWPVSAFIIGSVARQAPSYFRDLRAAGATIEDHTDDHPELPKLPADAQRAEICGPHQAYGSLVGATPTLLRPPYGDFDDTTRRATAECGMATIVLWNATMQDGDLHIVGRQTFRPGDIVLLHFRPTLLRDLQTLASMFAAAHLRVARLENYVS